jgi:hypothetical protein
MGWRCCCRGPRCCQDNGSCCSCLSSAVAHTIRAAGRACMPSRDSRRRRWCQLHTRCSFRRDWGRCRCQQDSAHTDRSCHVSGPASSPRRHLHFSEKAKRFMVCTQTRDVTNVTYTHDKQHDRALTETVRTVAVHALRAVACNQADKGIRGRGEAADAWVAVQLADPMSVYVRVRVCVYVHECVRLCVCVCVSVCASPLTHIKLTIEVCGRALGSIVAMLFLDMSLTRLSASACALPSWPALGDLRGGGGWWWGAENE